jgi:DNA-binding phage protein
MGEVKTALEKALEKVKDIKGLSEEERKELRDRETIRTALSNFFRGDIKRDGLIERLRGIGKTMIIEAQKDLAGLIRLNISEDELNQKREAILSLEMVKERGDMASIEEALNVIRRIQKEYIELREKAINEVRAAIEENPHLRVRPVRMPDGRTVLQTALTVDEAVQERLAEFLDEHDKRYERMFSRAVERLKNEFR